MKMAFVQKYDGRGRFGYVLVRARDYLAWWRIEEPGTLFVRDPSRNGPDWVEWQLGCRLDIVENEVARAVHLIPEYFEPTTLEKEHDPCAEHEAETYSMHFSVRERNRDDAEIRLTFFDDRIEYTAKVRVAPGAQLSAVVCGVGEQGRGSVFDADLIFDPKPQTHGMFHHAPHRPLTASHNWFGPPPFCYPLRLRQNGTWMSVALETTLDRMQFHEFIVQPDTAGRPMFVTGYHGCPEIGNAHEAFETPTVCLRFGARDEFAALRGHADGLVAAGRLPKVQRTPVSWHRGIMVCGWENQYQMYLASKRQITPQSVCTQAVYEAHVAALDRAGIDFDMLTIDCGWHRLEGDWFVDPERWPDLRGFVDRLHQRGRRVILWICHRKGTLPDDALGWITDPAGKRHDFIDPYNEKWLAHIRGCFETMLGSGPGGYAADGIKLDFTGDVPGSGRQQAVKIMHGMEYLHAQFKAIHDAAKRVRSDCLLDFQVANPHFAELYDMTRLNDFLLQYELTYGIMETRARIAEAVGFGALVDTDGSRDPGYLRNAYKLGNPSLLLSNHQLDDPVIANAAREGVAAFRDYWKQMRS
jgi:hypothetical protein